MESLMGEFAKSKIDGVIKFLNNDFTVVKTKEEAEKIINMIGEPIIKRYLQKEMANLRLKKVDEIEDLKTRISKLEEQLQHKNTEGG